jgi:hypothetical protein
MMKSGPVKCPRRGKEGIACGVTDLVKQAWRRHALMRESISGAM